MGRHEDAHAHPEDFLELPRQKITISNKNSQNIPNFILFAVKSSNNGPLRHSNALFGQKNRLS